MHDSLRQLMDGLVLSGEIVRDVPAFLAHHGCSKTASHVADVAAEACRIAALVGANSTQAEIAGWLHDVSAVFPAVERVKVARQFGVEVLPEEAVFPMIIHQKLSAVLAHDLFGIDDGAILSAVGCHTTLKADASTLDKVVFVADKLAWDQPGTPPYRDELLAALETSLDRAALVYLQYLWDRRASLKVIHPWMRAAYHQLRANHG